MFYHLRIGNRDLERSEGSLRVFKPQAELIHRQRTVCSVEADDLLRFVGCTAAADHE